jgi:CRISPR locus-related DNA-binding protein
VPIAQIATVGLEPAHAFVGVRQFGAVKLYLVHGRGREVEKAAEDIKNAVSRFVPIRVYQVNEYDVGQAANTIRKIVMDEHKIRNQIYINLTGGRKTLGLAAMLAAFREADKVLKLFYVTEEKHEIIELPILPYQEISETKAKILKLISQDVIDVKEMSGRLNITETMIYNHIRDLTKADLVRKSDGGYRLTVAGKLMAEI